jgi:hypothetical protein
MRQWPRRPRLQRLQIPRAPREVTRSADAKTRDCLMPCVKPIRAWPVCRSGRSTFTDAVKRLGCIGCGGVSRDRGKPASFDQGEVTLILGHGRPCSRERRADPVRWARFLNVTAALRSRKLGFRAGQEPTFSPARAEVLLGRQQPEGVGHNNICTHGPT